MNDQMEVHVPDHDHPGHILACLLDCVLIFVAHKMLSLPGVLEWNIWCVVWMGIMMLLVAHTITDVLDWIGVIVL
jgi:hypothetical protein